MVHEKYITYVYLWVNFFLEIDNAHILKENIKKSPKTT